MARPLLTERDIQDAIASGRRRIETSADTLVTPLARELAASHDIEIVHTSAVPLSPSPGSQEALSGAVPLKPGNTIAFGADHGGYQLKQLLIEYVESLGYPVLDLGTSTEEPCDYPDFAFAVARAVADGKAWRGVVIDGAGIGSCVAANKILGIRAACCHNEFVARNAREHNDTNVLTLGSKVTGSELCKAILRTWLETWFAGGRHAGRVKKINEIEGRYLK
ncbi:MAG: ribose 5-phosphate isomerase B [Bacteroidota bacterium]